MSHSHDGTAATTENGTAQANPPARTASGRKSAYLWGAASGVALALFAPVLRPAARTAVKGGIRVGRYAKKLASNVKEEFEDIAMEAKADLDREGESNGRENED